MSNKIVTYSRKEIDSLNPKVEELDIVDIAHALSLITRGNGQIDYFYSVAQHSINCFREAKARNYSEVVQLALLLHDGSEAYLSDITRPVKSQLENYRDFEKVLQDLIYLKYIKRALTRQELALVKSIDDSMLTYELKELLDTEIKGNGPLTIKPDLEFKNMKDVEKEFLEIFNNLIDSI